MESIHALQKKIQSLRQQISEKDATIGTLEAIIQNHTPKKNIDHLLVLQQPQQHHDILPHLLANRVFREENRSNRSNNADTRREETTVSTEEKAYLLRLYRP